MEKTWVGQWESERRKIEEKQDDVAAGPRGGRYGGHRDWGRKRWLALRGKDSSSEEKGPEKMVAAKNARFRTASATAFRFPNKKGEETCFEWGP